MASKEKGHALYLTKEHERPKLFHADDVEDAKADGWKQPDFLKSNGTKWNDEDDLVGQDAAAEAAKVTAEIAAKKAAEKEKEEQRARDAADKERAAAPVVPDLKVEVVTPKKKK